MAESTQLLVNRGGEELVTETQKVNLQMFLRVETGTLYLVERATARARLQWMNGRYYLLTRLYQVAKAVRTVDSWFLRLVYAKLSIGMREEVDFDTRYNRYAQ